MFDLDEEIERMQKMLDRRERMALGVTCTEMIELITRLRESERDAERWRRMYDSALREAKQQYEWRMEDYECGGNEIMDGLHTLECRVIDQAMKERGDE